VNAKHIHETEEYFPSHCQVLTYSENNGHICQLTVGYVVIGVWQPTSSLKIPIEGRACVAQRSTHSRLRCINTAKICCNSSIVNNKLRLIASHKIQDGTLLEYDGLYCKWNFFLKMEKRERL